MPIVGQDALVKKRKQELKHAQDVKELYERKLKKVNDLYMELSAWKLRLEEAERALARRERQINNQGCKAHYKKKHRPFSVKTPDRFHKRPSRSLSTNRSRKSSPSTPEVLSTSPESPFKIPPPTMLLGHQYPNPCSTNPVESLDGGDPSIVVRENPMDLISLTHLESNLCAQITTNLKPTPVTGAVGIDWSRVKRVENGNFTLLEPVRGLIVSPISWLVI